MFDAWKRKDVVFSRLLKLSNEEKVLRLFDISDKTSRKDGFVIVKLWRILAILFLFLPTQHEFLSSISRYRRNREEEDGGGCSPPEDPLLESICSSPWTGRVRDVTMGRLHVSWPRNVSFRGGKLLPFFEEGSG